MNKELIEEIVELKKEKNAIILAHNYMTPDIYHGKGIADMVGDSLSLAIEAKNTNADIIVQAGVHFMAETSKILNPNKMVLIPDPNAGCSLADSITALDIKYVKQSFPKIPIITYINTTAEVKAECDITCTSSNAVEIVKSFGVSKVFLFPDRYLAKNINAQIPDVEVTPWTGYCEVHEKFTGSEIRAWKELEDDLSVLVHPECKPEVVLEADFTGSTGAMSDWVSKHKPKKVMLVTECSMSDNVAIDNPDVKFIRPCNLCPYMKMITLEKIRDCLKNPKPENVVTIAKETMDRARIPIERMLAV